MFPVNKKKDALMKVLRKYIVPFGLVGMLGACASAAGTATTTAGTQTATVAPIEPVLALLNVAADASTGISLISTALTGKGVVELAMDAVTGKDCRFDGLVREDRQLCEVRGSKATENDFKGLASLAEKKPEEKPTKTAPATTTTPTAEEVSNVELVSAAMPYELAPGSN
ncbi:MAG: hypothetical protein A2516_04505 [Alphaproteobacteria bacterium RIFOXYD12_FULL_60_8]|nr:MAG: hypothetical protein A2516_04505 [Alphaproteobacteria bacterium RIFOXYD12_FULL_60_8]